ncbi:MAG: Radical protein [Mucilaginibacter sp.]|nr:Radical protein [Mucilaginibacter sp.]
MKYSQFNSIVPYDDKFALYNAFSQKVIFLEETLKDLLKAAVNEGIDNLQNIHPTFYDYLSAEKFLTADDTDEIDLVKQLVAKIDNNTNQYLLTINPSMNCNFKCWYCYETHVKGSMLDEHMVSKINKFVSTTASKQEMQFFALSFFGGEPLLYFKKDVVPIIENYAKECKDNSVATSISFTTNGYLINDEFILFFKERNLTCSLQITLDGYKEKHDLVRYVSASKGSYETIITNIKSLLMNGFYVRLRINYTEKNIEDTHKIGAEFSDIPAEIKDNLLLIDFHRVWQDDKIDNTYFVVGDNIDQMRADGLNVSSTYVPNNVIESCYADKRNSAVINYNGDLFKCTARDFTTVKRAGYLSEDGELIWENGYLEKRMESKFKNKPCLTCPILPICNGGCSQHAFEHLGGDEYCVHSGDFNEKMRIVKSKVEELINAN